MAKTIIDNLYNSKGRAINKSGGEGTAYIFDDFVLKEYFPFQYWDIKAFGNYFNEIQKFHRHGCNTPQTIGWEIKENKTLLLQQRLKQQEFYPTEMKSVVDCGVVKHEWRVSPLIYIYDKCKSFCSKEEFYSAIQLSNPKDLLYQKIVKTYLNIFLETNKKLEGMDKKFIDKFVEDDRYMTCFGEYSIPDIHAGNVFIDHNADDIKNIMIIDNFFLNGDVNDCNNNEERTNVAVFTDMINLFKSNLELMKMINNFDSNIFADMEKIVQDNSLVSRVALRRFLEASIKSGGKPTNRDKNIRFQSKLKIAKEMAKSFGEDITSMFE